jgi:hypothetical protein
VRAHGLIKSSPAPAEPDRVGLPAHKVAEAASAKNANDVFMRMCN